MLGPRVLGALLLVAAGPAGAADIAVPAYGARCRMCHQANGAGLPGQFPRLAGRVDKIGATPDGRRYLVHVVLNGISGAIQVDNASIVGFMPAFAMLNDGDIAAILNGVGAAGGGKKLGFTPGEIAKVRAEPHLGPAGVAAERARLVAAKAIP
jgi:mono/diheme cytochrome c family protein